MTPGKRRFDSIWFLKAALSVFILYHLAAILVLPMSRGVVIRETGHYFTGYANLLGLNTAWQFFSPGPSPIFYLEYTFSYPHGDDVIDSEPRLLPEKREGFGLSDHYSRRLYSMRFLSLDPVKLENYLVPWLCGKDPKAESVTVRQMFGQIQSVEKFRIEDDVESFKDMSTVPVNMPRATYACPVVGEAVPTEESGGSV